MPLFSHLPDLAAASEPVAHVWGPLFAFWRTERAVTGILLADCCANGPALV